MLLPAVAGAMHFNPTAPEVGGEDVISAHDGKGTFYTVYNLFDGRNNSIQVNRLNAGGVLWTVEHADNVREKAYAAAVDADGNLFVVGERLVNRQKYMLLLKFGPGGALQREVTDNNNDCGATSVLVDHDNWVVAAGLCRYGDNRPVRIVKFDNDLGFYWGAEYDRGGRNYLHALQADIKGVISASIEGVYGDIRDGSYRTITAVYTAEGQLQEER